MPAFRLRLGTDAMLVARRTEAAAREAHRAGETLLMRALDLVPEWETGARWKNAC